MHNTFDLFSADHMAPLNYPLSFDQHVLSLSGFLDVFSSAHILFTFLSSFLSSVFLSQCQSGEE